MTTGWDPYGIQSTDYRQQQAHQRITHHQYGVPHLQEKRQASQRASVVVCLLASWISMTWQANINQRKSFFKDIFANYLKENLYTMKVEIKNIAFMHVL